MIPSIVFSMLLGVLQIFLLASLSRTIRLRTALLSMATGFYTCSLVALTLQYTWTRAISATFKVPLYTVVETGSFTIDPFIEEFFKIAPLAFLFWFLPNVRRQWSLADCIVMGASAGSGFGLAEELFTWSSWVPRAIPVDGGWALPNLAFPFVPAPLRSLFYWLPSGVRIDDFALGSAFQHNLHLVWSSLGGFAIGMAFLKHNKVARAFGAALILYIGLDHASVNFTSHSGPAVFSGVVNLMNRIRELLWFMPVLALAIAWWFDRSSQSLSSNHGLALTKECFPCVRNMSSFRSAVAKVPWAHAIFELGEFIRLRRAFASQVKRNSGEAECLNQEIVRVRDRFNGLMTGLESVTIPSIAQIGSALSKVVRQPKAILMCVLMLPCFIWFLVGAFPQTSFLRALLITQPGWTVVKIFSSVGLVWMASRLVSTMWRFGKAGCAPLGEMAAGSVLSIASNTGTLALGVYALFLSLTGNDPNSSLIHNFHVLECFAGAALIGVLLTATAGLVVPLLVESAFTEGLEYEMISTLVGRQSAVSLSAEAASEFETAEAFSEIPTAITPAVSDGLAVAGSDTADTLQISSMIRGERGPMGFVQNAMNPQEVSLAIRAAEYRGGTFIGANETNQIAIDGYWQSSLGNTPAQLYTMQSADLSMIAEKVVHTELMAAKSGWSGIELYVDATSTGMDAGDVAQWVTQQGRIQAAVVLGVVSEVNILGADGLWFTLFAQ